MYTVNSDQSKKKIQQDNDHDYKYLIGENYFHIDKSS